MHKNDHSWHCTDWQIKLTSLTAVAVHLTEHPQRVGFYQIRLTPSNCYRNWKTQLAHDKSNERFAQVVARTKSKLFLQSPKLSVEGHFEFEKNEQHEIQISLFAQEIKRFQGFDSLLISTPQGCSFWGSRFYESAEPVIYIYKGIRGSQPMYRRNQP